MNNSAPPSKNIGLDLVRVTEAAALAAGRWMGRGDRESANQAATDAMVTALNQLDIDGLIVIGEEGRLHEHSALDSGMSVGTGNGPQVDVVVNPIDGASLVAEAKPYAISVAGIAPRGTMWSSGPGVYMEKVVVDRHVAAALVPECLDAPAAWTIALVARIKDKPVKDVVVFVLERPRHAALIEEIRTAGARALLRLDGDINGALMAVDPNTSVDILMGIGGVPEGIISACAIKALRGAMIGRLAPQSPAEKEALAHTGLDPHRILLCDELVTSEKLFFAATGVTDGRLLNGVRYRGRIAETHSIVLRGETGTRRIIHTEHVVKP